MLRLQTKQERDRDVGGSFFISVPLPSDQFGNKCAHVTTALSGCFLESEMTCARQRDTSDCTCRMTVLMPKKRNCIDVRQVGSGAHTF